MLNKRRNVSSSSEEGHPPPPPLHDDQAHRLRRIDSQLPPFLQHAKDVRTAERRLTIKNEVIAAVGEFVGTFLFLFFAFGIATVAQNPTQPQLPGLTSSTLNQSQLLYLSLGFGFALAVNAWLFFRVSGGLFNPAVALALVLTGNLTVIRFPIAVLMEFLGALAAAGMSQVLIPGGNNASVSLAPGTSVARGFFIEFFLSLELLLSVLLLAGEKHRGGRAF